MWSWITKSWRDDVEVWRRNLPPYIVAVDVETTGLHSDDRVVSLGAVKLDLSKSDGANFSLQAIHLIFDPRRRSHPKAEAVHGYDDWLLRHQDPFEDHAEFIWKFIHGAPLIVAHNAPFDASFIEREFALSACPPISRKITCTMERHRTLGRPGRASLTNICRDMGLARASEHHSALEDAFFALLVCLNQHGCNIKFDVPVFSPPGNLRSASPHPGFPLPRRSKKVKLLGTLPRGSEI